MKIIEDKFYSMTTPERIELNNRLNSFLYPIMNKIHGSNYSERFWRILLAPYITAINTRRKTFNEDNLNIHPCIEPINSFVYPTLKEKLIINLKYIVKAIKTRNLITVIEQTLKEKDNISFGFHDPSSVKLDFPNYLETYYPLIKVSKKKIKRAVANKIAESMENHFEKNVIRQIPGCCIEYFDYYINSIKLFSPKNKTFHVSMLETTYMRFLLAKYLEHGAKLNYYQHGAFYGEYKYYSPYAFEYLIADNYYTWGWKMHDKDIPWKAYRLNKFYRNYTLQHKEKIYDCLIVFPQISKQNFENFRTSTSLLINNISRDKYRKIMIRPRPSATDLKYDEQFSFIKDDRVVIDSGKSVIGNLICQSKLVIQYSYPSTNLLECLYVDHPSVVILKNDQPTAIVKPYYDFFLAQGVFHFNFETLTQHLNSIDVDTWWQSIVSHPTYKSFKIQFLRKE